MVAQEMIDESLLDELAVFVEEFERLVVPASSESLIKLMQSISPEEVKKADATGKTLEKSYLDEIFSPVGDVARKISSLSKENITISEFTPLLQDFDEVLHNLERYVGAFYGFIEEKSLSSLQAIDTLEPAHIQGYTEYEGNYNDFIRSYRRYRLKLYQKHSFAVPDRRLMKDICSLKYPPEE